MKVRIAVAVWPGGTWRAAGAASWHDLGKAHEASRGDDRAVIRWVEAEVPGYPQPVTVEGTVVDQAGQEARR